MAGNFNTIGGASITRYGHLCAPLDVTTRDEIGRTPLHLAVAKGNVPRVRTLLALGAQVEARIEGVPIVPKPLWSRRGNTVLHEAIMEGRNEEEMITIINLLLVNANPDIVHRVNHSLGQTPLHLAAQKGYTKVMQILLNHGAKIDAQDRDGNTPLHDASLNGQAKAISFLLDRGVSVQVLNHLREDPLYLAVKYLRNRAGESENQRIQVIESLVEKGANVRLKNAEGTPTLHLLAETSGYENLFILLLDHGADVDDTNRNDETFLHRVIHLTQSNIMGEYPTGQIVMAIDRGANIEAKDAQGQTPLHAAASCNNTEAIRLLLLHNAQILRDNHDQTPSQLTTYDSIKKLFQTYLEITTSKQTITVRNSNNIEIKIAPLKALATLTILRHNIPYQTEDNFPAELKTLIQTINDLIFPKAIIKPRYH